MQELISKAWFEKYRPRDINDIIFPDDEKELLIKQFIQQGYIQGNILSYGRGGVGKTTINKVLQGAIVQNAADIFVLGRSVEDVDELSGWLMKQPTASKQMIVVCEEFDKLSPKALSVLKDGLLEKYQPKVSFIVTTNKIHKLEAPLLQRFNIKLNFNEINLDKLGARLENILRLENISYTKEDFEVFLNKCKNKGIRDIINDLQLASFTGTFKISSIGMGLNSGVEDDIVNILKWFFMYPQNLTKDQTISLREINKIENIKQYYEWLNKVMLEDPTINYDYIFMTLIESNLFLPINNILIKYYQDLDMKKFKNLHVLACLSDIIEFWIELKK